MQAEATGAPSEKDRHVAGRVVLEELNNSKVEVEVCSISRLL